MKFSCRPSRLGFAIGKHQTVRDVLTAFCGNGLLCDPLRPIQFGDDLPDEVGFSASLRRPVVYRENLKQALELRKHCCNVAVVERFPLVGLLNTECQIVACEQPALIHVVPRF